LAGYAAPLSIPNGFATVFTDLSPQAQYSEANGLRSGIDRPIHWWFEDLWLQSRGVWRRRWLASHDSTMLGVIA